MTKTFFNKISTSCENCIGAHSTLHLVFAVKFSQYNQFVEAMSYRSPRSITGREQNGLLFGSWHCPNFCGDLERSK